MGKKRTATAAPPLQPPAITKAPAPPLTPATPSPSGSHHEEDLTRLAERFGLAEDFVASARAAPKTVEDLKQPALQTMSELMATATDEYRFKAASDSLDRIADTAKKTPAAPGNRILNLNFPVEAVSGALAGLGALFGGSAVENVTPSAQAGPSTQPQATLVKETPNERATS